MVIASRILGVEVGSTALAFLAVLAVHVAAGLTAVITGAAAALARKGSPRHIRAGRWYHRAITTVFATAIALAAMRWTQDWYLGAAAFTAATAGYLHRRRHRVGDTGHIAGMGIGKGRGQPRPDHRVPPGGPERPGWAADWLAGLGSAIVRDHGGGEQERERVTTPDSVTGLTR